jgi:hypothetical protein
MSIDEFKNTKRKRMIASLKKFPLKTVLLTLIAWCLFWEIKETITHERMIFFMRWFYSDMGHAKDIEVKTYLLNDEHVFEMLLHPNEEIQQPTQRQLSSKNISAVLRIRNLTDGVAWGRLSWKLPYSPWKIVDVPFIPVSGMKEKYVDIIISAGTLAMTRRDELPEQITVKWDSLYVYR